MKTDFSSELLKFKDDFDQRSTSYFMVQAQSPFGSRVLQQSVSYSFFSGGKRFRPFLSYLTGQCLNLDFDDIFPIALATELIHTYSLIHDDLPCMDNDDFRRGQPTNHKKFGEATALLAGDALLTDAFHALTLLKKADPQAIIQVVREFSLAAGSLGMVSGQTQDMQAGTDMSLDQLNTIHYLKTARLIENSISSVAIIAEVTETELQAFRQFGKNLGIAFQIKDDLLDINDNDQDQKSFPFLVGQQKTEQTLEKLTQDAHQNLIQLKRYNTDFLGQIINYNFYRNQ